VDRFDGDAAVLRGDAAHHLGRVLRAEPGQLYELSDGTAVWLARTERVARKTVEFSLVEPLPAGQARLRVALLLAIIKFERFEWSLEKATELGVDEIVPLIAARSEKALVAAAGKRAARWQKIPL
jgi:16S rRNA (uracil1498-N3)-methyltransferase